MRQSRALHTHTACLGIEHYCLALIEVGKLIEIGVAYAGTGLDNRNCGVLANKINQSAAAARNNQIDQTLGMKQCLGGTVSGGEQLHQVGVESMLGKHLVNNLHYGAIGTVGIASAFQHTGISTLEA